MHPLHDYIATRIAEKVRERHVVVIYDPNSDLSDFFVEAAAGAELAARLVPVALNGKSVQLFTVDGSLLEARVAVEPLTGGDEPQEVIIHAPGLARGEAKNSLLMELEKAGVLYTPPALRSYARNVLRKRHDDGAIDAMLQSERLTYQDLAGLCRGEDGGGSLLRAVFDTSDTTNILAAWLATRTSDAELDKKGAWGELRDLARARLGLALPDEADGERLRAVAARYVLANEFRSDLLDGATIGGSAGPLVAAIADVPGKDELKAVRDLARRLRERDPAVYIALADDVERDLQLGMDCVPGAALGTVDTFRFEEVAAARAAIQLVAEGRSDAAKQLVSARSESFWVARDDVRQALWQVCRLMIDVCDLAGRTRQAVDRGPSGGARGWIDRYAAADDDAWFRLDRAQRHFETWLPAVEDDIDPVAVAAVRAQYEDAVRRMTEGFVKALGRANWSVPEVLHHTRIWPEVVASRARPVAYIFVDAMRYEMGFELAERIGATNEVQLRPALAALPSITPVGMAALLPGSAASFSVVQQGGRLGSSIEGVFLPDRAARQKFLAGKAPGVVSMDLDDVLSLNAKQLEKRVGESKLVAIHSTDIDGAGENAISNAAARRIMDNVIGDLARCLRNLAAAGVEDAVVTSDHGHLFFAGDRPTAMRMDAPGGDTVDLHRRCWIGRGGATPPGAVRVSGATLGYDTDLEFAFPISTAVFKAGGDLAFHHGGPSLQEMVVPVLAVKARKRATAPAAGSPVTVTHDFAAITNRIFTIKVELTGRARGLFDEGLTVRPLVISAGREVAQAALAAGADLQNGRLTLQPQTPVSVGFMLTDDEATGVRIQILDAETDAVLYASAADIPVKLGV